MNELQSIFQEPLGNAGTITADSRPDTPTKWGCEDWKFWHQLMVKKYGQKQANTLFMSEWDKQSGFDYHFNFCKYNSAWIDYFMSQGLDMRSILSALVVGGSEIVDNTLNTVNSTVETAGSLVKSTKFVVPAVIFTALGLAGFIIYKNSDKLLNVISK